MAANTGLMLALDALTGPAYGVDCLLTVKRTAFPRLTRCSLSTTRCFHNVGVLTDVGLRRCPPSTVRTETMDWLQAAKNGVETVTIACALVDETITSEMTSETISAAALVT